MPSGSLTGLLDFCLNPAQLQELQGVAMAIQQWHNDNKNVSMTFWLPYQAAVTCDFINLVLDVRTGGFGEEWSGATEDALHLSQCWWTLWFSAGRGLARIVPFRRRELLEPADSLYRTHSSWVSNPAEYTFTTVLLHEWTSVGAVAGHLPFVSVGSIFSPEPRSLLSQQIHKRSKLGLLALLLPTTSYI